MNLRHIFTQGFALLLLAGVCVGLNGCKPEDAADDNPPANNGETEAPGETGAHDDTDANIDPDIEGGSDTDPSAEAPGTDAAGGTDPSKTPAVKEEPTDKTTLPPTTPEAGSATDGGADDKIPPSPPAPAEAGSGTASATTPAAPEKIPGTTPASPEAGSSTK